MTTLYKLTDQDWNTRGPTKWGPGVTHTAPGKGELCSSGWIHAYEHPLLALLLNPIHADFRNPVLWRAEGIVGKRDRGLKVGVARLTTIEQMEIPNITLEQRVKFGIYCSMEVYKETNFAVWCERWLSGQDRSRTSAAAAYAAANAADANYAIAYAADAAAYAAGAAAYAANADAANYAANYAANAADASAAFELISCATRACT